MYITYYFIFQIVTCVIQQRKLEDTKDFNQKRKLKDIQYNGQKKKKDNMTSNNLQNITKKTKLKLYIKRGQRVEGEPICSGMVSSSCPTSVTINVCFIRLTSILGT